MRRAQACGGLIAALAALALAAPAARAWTPEAATYGLGSQTNLAVTMSDGTVLRAPTSTTQPIRQPGRRPPAASRCS